VLYPRKYRYRPQPPHSKAPMRALRQLRYPVKEQNFEAAGLPLNVIEMF